MKCKALTMTALQKLNSSPQLPPKRLNQSQIIGNPFLLDDKQFKKYQKIINRFIGTKYDTTSIYDLIDKIINWGLLPSDYHQRHIMRLMAQGIYIKPSILEVHDIVIYDGLPQGLHRRKPEKRLPNSPFDFVLINPSKWQNYPALQRFYDYLPKRPYCSTAKDGKTLILDKDKAIKLSHIQPNHPLFCHCLVFDIDEKAGRNAFSTWQKHNLPPPNIIVKNPFKDSCHYIYLLAKPVGNAKNKTDKAVKHLDAIYERMRVLLSADIGYCGSRMKNPLSSKHDCFVSGAKPYTSEQLADKLDLYTYEYWQEINRRKSQELEQPQGYLGRNCAIFDNVRYKGYSNSDMSYEALYYYLLSECEQYNKTHYSRDQLPSNELSQIAKSIAKFCKTRLDGNYSNAFRARQSYSGSKGAKVANAQGANSKGGQARSATYDPKRQQAEQMHKQGVKIKDIAEQLQVTRQTLNNWGIKARNSKQK